MLPEPIDTLTLGEAQYPSFPEALPSEAIFEGSYSARFVSSTRELEDVLRLRFDVFNLELGEGLETSFLTGLDRDQYDDNCHHLAVYCTGNAQVVGTYRIQTSAMAAASSGFYSSQEFDLANLPTNVIDQSVELGRACIAPAHRNTQVLFLLWKGLAAYVQHNRKRFLFGCCSLTSQDPDEGLSVYRDLGEQGLLHQEISIEPQRECDCRLIALGKRGTQRVSLPRLFRTYLRFGAKVCGPPAIDRQFGTIDFLVLFDVDAMDPASHHLFFGS
jgi:putative hemolysin